MIYRAKHEQTVAIWGGTVEVEAGELVDFPAYPGENFEEVKPIVNHPRQSRRVVAGEVGSGSGDNQGSV